LTASGSLGLLLPPALPLILYAVIAQIPIEDIFIGGILPGILLTTMVAAYGMREGIVSGAGRQPFDAPEALAATWAAKWELAMPALVLVAMFSGFATAVEAAALTAVYALVVQTLVHRDLSLGKDLLRVVTECVTVVGGVLIILGVAVGLTNYLINAQVPAILVDWARAHITSRFTFLLLLNVFLLAVGWLMEIYAAIVVVVPLIVPLGACRPLSCVGPRYRSKRTNCVVYHSFFAAGSHAFQPSRSLPLSSGAQPLSRRYGGSPCASPS